MSKMTTTTKPSTSVSITPDVLLAYWQDERLQTRQLIESFPEDHLFFYSMDGMKPFSELAWEIISMSIPAVVGITSGHWQPTGSFSRSWNSSTKPFNKRDLLTRWDETTDEINRLWETMPAERLNERQTVFGLGSGPVYSFVLRYIDQEIQHRCQAILYLKSLSLK